MLIARPAAIFGVDSNFWAPGDGPDRESNEKGTSAQRLVAVWWATCPFSWNLNFIDLNQRSDGRGTGCNWRMWDTAWVSQVIWPTNKLAADTTIRAIGKRAHPLHAMTFFSTQCVVASSVAYVHPSNWLYLGCAKSRFRMLVIKTHIVIPTRLDWIALFAVIGFFGFFAQVLGVKVHSYTPTFLISPN